MSENEELARNLSHLYSLIYFHCHPQFELELSHQAVRSLQFISIHRHVTVQEVAKHLGVAQNTSSEIVRRLVDKGLVVKHRRKNDERVVEVVLTENGEQAVMEHTGLDIHQLAASLNRLESEQCVQIEQALSLLLSAVGGDNLSCS